MEGQNSEAAAAMEEGVTGSYQNVRDCSDFSKVVDIACAASTALDQATKAGEKAQMIAAMARDASKKAAELLNLAECLVATASSVANIAISATQFRDFHQAFDSNAEFGMKIEFDQFERIVTKQVHFEEPLPAVEFTEAKKQGCLSPISSRPDQDGMLIDSVRQEPGHTQTSNCMDDLDTSGVHQTRRQSYPEHRRIRQPNSMGSLPTTPHVFNEHSKSMVIDNEDSSQNKYNKDKYPSSISALEYKDNLAATFDSKIAITPLWEDRYIHDAAKKDAKTTSFTRAPEKWIDKKALKQFQIKLHSVPHRAEYDEHMYENYVSNANRSLQNEDASKRRDNTNTKDKLETLQDHGSYQFSDCESDSDLSTDSELDGIFRDPRPLRKLKRLETIQGNQGTSGRHQGQLIQGEENEASRLNVRKSRERSLSPLLNTTEKESYMASREDPVSALAGGRKTKQYFALASGAPNTSNPGNKQ